MPFYADESSYSKDEIELWERMKQCVGITLHTAKNLPFTYEIKGNELFISRKTKSVTRSTVNIAYRKAKEIIRADGVIKGPKALGTFGASYILPIFLYIGI